MTGPETARLGRRDHREPVIRRAFALFRATLEDWARRKPARVTGRIAKLRDQAENGSTIAALEIAILEGLEP